MTIDEYLTKVRSALTHHAAHAGLEDLRAALVEAAATNGETAACEAMGDPVEFAAQLDAEFTADQPDEFDPPRASHLFGIPWNLSVTADWWRRLFNPADERIIVPHAFGLGWAINLGAVAVRLGAIQPDDVDDEVLAELRPRDAAVPLAIAGTLAAYHAIRSRRLGAIGAIGAAAIPTLIKAPLMDRMAAQTLAYAVLGANLTRSRKPWTSGLGALAGVGCGLAACTIPLRAAIRRTATNQRTTSGESHAR